MNGRGADTPAGFSRESFRLADSTLAWWGRLTPRFVSHADRIRMRWRDPDGEIRSEDPASSRGRVFVTSKLELSDASQRRAGLWTVETLLDGDVVDRRQCMVSR